MSITKTKNAVRTALSAAAMIMAAGSVQAEAPYVLTAIDTAGHGADVVNGQYEKAIARIRRDGVSDLSFSESTNLCIAYTKTRNTANAIKSCDLAVEIARETNGMPRSRGLTGSGSLRRKDLDLVIALSNRSVAHATNGDYSLAFEDLREADALSPYLRAVSKNLAVVTEASAR